MPSCSYFLWKFSSKSGSLSFLSSTISEKRNDYNLHPQYLSSLPCQSIYLGSGGLTGPMEMEVTINSVPMDDSSEHPPESQRRKMFRLDVVSIILIILGVIITSFWYLREIGWWGILSGYFDNGFYDWAYQVDPSLGHHGIILLIAPLLFWIGALILSRNHWESRWGKVPLIVAFSLFILWWTVIWAGSSEYVL